MRVQSLGVVIDADTHIEASPHSLDAPLRHNGQCSVALTGPGVSPRLQLMVDEPAELFRLAAELVEAGRAIQRAQLVAVEAVSR
jgi:hypothetical protein